MNDRRAFLAKVGFGVSSLLLPSAAQAFCRRKRRCSRRSCCETCGCKMDGQFACPFDETMILNGHYYYVCYVCPPGPVQGYVGRRLDSELTEPWGGDCRNCYYELPYPILLRNQHANTFESVDLNHSPEEKLKSCLPYDQKPDTKKSKIATAQIRGSVKFSIGTRQTQARLFDVSVKGNVNKTWRIGHESVMNDPNQPKTEPWAVLDNYYPTGYRYYMRLVVRWPTSTQQFLYHVALCQ
jgi:hypothetical protein